jgi:hypothetical protein
MVPPIAETATPAYLSREALAQHASVSLRSIDNWLVDPVRPLPSYRFGRRVLVRLADFEAWAQAHRCAGGTLEERIRTSKPLAEARRRLKHARSGRL